MSLARRFAPVVALLALVACGAAPVPGAEAKARAVPIERSPLLWATVNVCDTPRHPDTVGVRASIPGDGAKDERLWLRLRLQYHSPRDHRWHDVPKGADSGWLDVGTARYKARETGELFSFMAPKGTPDRLRGLVTFEWRRGSHVVRRVVHPTSAGHRSHAGADPPGYSAATCLLRP